MCQPNVQFTANLGAVQINTANGNLNGTGAMGTVFTSNGINGAIVNSIDIKATGNTTLGMVRIFISNGITNFLYKEVMIPANTQTGVVQAFAATIDEPFTLQSGFQVLASTENAENFNVIAKGYNRNNCEC